jgi:GNAT superfamily N-acetyltransferase
MQSDMSDGGVRIEPWGEGDLPILEKALGDPEMTRYIGGPESPEKIAERQMRYERPDSVLPGFQGRGIATMATAQAIAVARAEKRHRFLHAYPSVNNAPSNGICRKLGFTLVEECEFEYPKGSFMRCNDWRLDLFGDD